MEAIFVDDPLIDQLRIRLSSSSAVKRSWVHVASKIFFKGLSEGVSWYLFEVNNGNTRIIYEICSKLAIKKSERRQWRRFGFGFGFSNVVFEQLRDHYLILAQILSECKRINKICNFLKKKLINSLEFS